MHHRAEGIGQICLQHDSGFEFRKFGSVQNLGENRKGDVEVFELFHIEIDERRILALGRKFVEREEALDDVCDVLVV